MFRLELNPSANPRGFESSAVRMPLEVGYRAVNRTGSVKCQFQPSSWSWCIGVAFTGAKVSTHTATGTELDRSRQQVLSTA